LVVATAGRRSGHEAIQEVTLLALAKSVPVDGDQYELSELTIDLQWIFKQ
jgi:hypothetical protein